MLIMMEAKAEAIDNLRVVLLWFEVVAGLAINVRKIKMSKINNCQNLDDQMTVWGYQRGELPTVYLGLPLVVGFKAKDYGSRLWIDSDKDSQPGSVNT